MSRLPDGGWSGWVIPIAMVLDKNVLGCVHPACEYLSVDGDLSVNMTCILPCMLACLFPGHYNNYVDGDFSG